MNRPGEVAGWPKLVVTYLTDPSGIEQLVPPGLVPGEPVVTVGVYCVPILGEPEFGISIKVPASWRGTAGLYNLGMGIDQEAAVSISHETNGQPKFLCDISFYRLGDHVAARATHQGYTFVEFGGEVTGPAEVDRDDVSDHEWWIKYSRAIGGADGQYDFPPHVVDVATTFEQRHVEDIDGELKLLHSPWDPVARYLPIREQLSAQLVTHQAKARSITNAGPVDPAAFWPHADTIGASRWPGTRGGPRAD
jgi:acetoacetate decarboxylase